MGSAAVLGMLLSTIGIGLLWITFDATREANRIARENVYLDKRPWMTIKLPKVIPETQADGTRRFKARVKVTNRGGGPALAVQVKASFFGASSYKQEDVLSYVKPFTNGAVTHSVGTVIFPDLAGRPRIAGDVSEIGQIDEEFSILIVCATYEAVGIPRILYAGRAFIVETKKVVDFIDDKMGSIHDFTAVLDSDLVG